MKRSLGFLKSLPIPFLGKSNSNVAGEYLIHDDISNGRELNKIPVYSYKRNDEIPDDFHYVTDQVTLNPINLDLSLASMMSCSCQNNCTEANCDCSRKLNRNKVYNSRGRLSSKYNVDAPEIIYECNVGCGCNRKNCSNMVIQNGCKAKVMLFKTKARGWGVRTLETLKRGTFLGTYTGELISAVDSFKRKDDTYLFNLAGSSMNSSSHQQTEPTVTDFEGGNLVTGSTADLNGSSRTQPEVQYEADQQVAADEATDQEEHEVSHEGRREASQPERDHYVCDAKFYGNFTRFINHSCEPNVIGVRTFTVHQDTRVPNISFFTREEVPANTELTLNYGDNYWLVKCKRDHVYCLCRKPMCRFNKKTFPRTLKEHLKQREQVEA